MLIRLAVERRNPIQRLHDGEYGTMAWRARVPQGADERPWVRFDFDQPQRRRPYLAGQFVWQLRDEADTTAVLHEEINTPTALAIVDRPLHGSPWSFRRWLFFAGGHQRLMKEATANIRHLLATDTTQPG